MTTLGVFGAPRPGVTLPQLEADTDAVLADVIAKGVSDEESGARQVAA